MSFTRGTVRTAGVTYTVVVEYDGSNNPIYIGLAPKGLAKSDTAWQIRKLTFSGTNCTDIQYAGGTEDFTNVWNDRASLSYS